MNTEVKKLWTDALRSGRYKQGQGILFNERTKSYCCLGVLCDLYAKQTELGKWQKLGDNYVAFTDSSQLQETVCLTNAVIQWAGLEHESPFIGEGEDKISLIHMNDFDNKSFDDIADVIEKHF